MFEFLKKKINLPLIQLPMPKQSETQMRQKVLDDTLSNYLDLIKTNQLPYANNIVNKYGAEAVTNGIQQGLNFGVPEIAQWQQQYNNGAGVNNPIQIPTTPSEISLARQNQFNNNNYITGDIQGNSRQNVWDKFLNGIQDLQSGFNENANTPFSVENLRQNPDKNLMTRIGEGLGTAGRFISSPYGRGLAVAGIVGATGGNPLEMMAYGGQTMVNNQANRMRNTLYRTKLKEMGYDDNFVNSIPSYIDNDTFKNFADSSYKLEYNQYRNRKLDQDSYIKIKSSYDNMLKNNMIDPYTYEQYMEKLNNQFIQDNISTASGDKTQESNDTKKTNSQIQLNNKRGNYLDIQAQEAPKRTKIQQQNANTNQQRANSYDKYVNQFGNTMTGSKGSGRKNPDFGYNLAEYLDAKKSGDQNKINYGRQMFITKFGEDPEKLIKTDYLQELLGGN